VEVERQWQAVRRLEEGEEGEEEVAGVEETCLKSLDG